MSEVSHGALLHLQQAGALAGIGRYEEALTQAELAVAERPDVLVTHLRAAAIEMELGRHGAALERLDALEKSPSHRMKPGC